jgi:beta-glucanase (GH16 family)
MIRASRLLIVVCLLAIVTVTSADQHTRPFIRGDAPVDIELLIDNFESGVPLAADSFGNGIGLVPWGSEAENVQLAATQLIGYSRLALPGSIESPRTVLGVHYDIGSWGGFTHAFTDGENWISMDWSAYNVLSLWLYGNETDGIIQIEIFDNRNPALDGDSAERFYFRLIDNYSGWRQFTIPFHLFHRRTDWQPGGAPDDGLDLTEVHGYAIGFPGGVGPQVAYIDMVGLTTVEDTSVVTVYGPASQEIVIIDTSISWNSRQWELVWSDEFEGAAGTPVNPEYWNHDIGGHGWGNNELQYHSDRTENVSLDGSGHLAIVARQENPAEYVCHYGECVYTSARITTQGKVEFTYGRVEARIKVPRGQGIWPAFWMLGASFPGVSWPNSGEIDIMEHIGFEPRTVYGTVHGPDYSGTNGVGSSYTINEDFADNFHVFAVDWDPDAIRWYVDGILYSILTPDHLGGRQWVFDHNFFILLNLSVGGDWPGEPDETTQFPQTMLVDYVRVYQLAGE